MFLTTQVSYTIVHGILATRMQVGWNGLEEAALQKCKVKSDVSLVLTLFVFKYHIV